MRVLFFIFLLSPLFSNGQIITTIAGNGVLGYSGDTGPATNAKLHLPGKVLVGVDGNLYIADTWNHVIRKVNEATGIITTIAGTGTYGYNGDGIPATSAQLNAPYGLVQDSALNIYIGDDRNNRVRKIDHITGIITTFAGNGINADTGIGAAIGDGEPATAAELGASGCLALDKTGNLYISDATSMVVRKVDIVTGIITNFVGNGYGAGTTVGGYSGDGGPATDAELNNPCGIAFDDSGNLYIADYVNQRIRKVTASTGIITTVAGDGTPADAGDGFPATASEVHVPYDIVFDAAGDYYFTEFPGKVREVNAAGIINTVAGTSIYGYNGDDILADTAELNETTGISLDICGSLYIADASNERIRKVTYPPTPIILTNNIAALDTVCSGTPITYAAAATASSGTITYQWYLNGIPVIGATTSTYNYTPANGDSIRCVATAANACASAVTSSNTITMVVAPVLTPTITLSGVTATPVGATVTVSATVSGAGSSYSIKWYNHGTLFATTAVPVVTYTKPPGTDTITALIAPGAEPGGCYDSTTSAAHIVTASTTGVGVIVSLPNGGRGEVIYPNPVKDVLYVDISGNVGYKILGIVGATMQQGTLIQGSNTINVKDLSAGVYMLEIVYPDGFRVTNKIIKQ